LLPLVSYVKRNTSVFPVCVLYLVLIMDANFSSILSLSPFEN
jgi:hypothetical protein